MNQFRRTLGLGSRAPGQTEPPRPKKTSEPPAIAGPDARAAAPSAVDRRRATPAPAKATRQFFTDENEVSRSRERARQLQGWLDGLLHSPELTAAQCAAIDSVWATFDWLKQLRTSEVAQVAHLVSRASSAIRAHHGRNLEQALRACAEVLHEGLPTRLRATVSVSETVVVVTRLRSASEAWAGAVDASATLLGWSALAREHALGAIQLAITAAKTSANKMAGKQ